LKRNVNTIRYAMLKPGFFSDDLILWYKKNARDLPWRRTRDPYKIWVSEIMLQQTTVNAVIPYYERWIKQFPTIQTLAKSRLQKVLKLWQGLGYYQRAKNLHRSAKIICREHDGGIPDRPELLKTLPGFGPYTVGAVLSIAFNKRFSIIDANVRRVVMRLLALKGEAGLQWDLKISNFLDRVLPQRECGTFNQALMELGALVCRNRQPLCSCCPVENYCRACKKGVQELIPAVKKGVFVPVEAVVAVIEKDGRYLIQKRPSQGLLADLWEFPGGKIESG
jgi:A/G-specific adenine glycosylase